MDKEEKKKPAVTVRLCTSLDERTGRGGFASMLTYGVHSKEMCAAYRRTTRERLEILACIVALEALKHSRCLLTLHVESDLLKDVLSLKSRIDAFQTGFQTLPGRPDGDLLLRLHRAIGRHEIIFVDPPTDPAAEPPAENAVLLDLVLGVIRDHPDLPPDTAHEIARSLEIAASAEDASIDESPTDP